MKYINCTVIFYFPDRKCFDAVSTDGSMFFENVSHDIKSYSGEGTENVPDIGSIVVLEVDDKGIASLYKYYASRKRYVVGTDDNHLTYFDTGNKKHRVPGDQSISSPDGASVDLLAGPIAKIGVSPLSQMVFVGLENFARLIAQNFEFLSGGMRVYTTTDNGKTTTKLCFADSDIAFSKGAIDNNELADYFDYVIEIGNGELSLISGDTKKNTAKRVNNLMMRIVQGEGFHFLSATDFDTKKNFVDLYMSSTGCIDQSLYNDQGKQVYGHSVLVTSDGKAHVNETIDGNFTRHITGNYEEKVSGETKWYYHNFWMGTDIATNFSGNMVRLDSPVIKFNPSATFEGDKS